MRIEILDDPAKAVAELLAGAASQEADIVLTGGSSPRSAYELAAQHPVDWSRASVWFSDERCVPPDDELSNYRMAEEALLSRVDPGPDVFRMRGELGPVLGAQAYEAEISAKLGPEPQFDVVLLGLGPDSHIASLFPGKPEVDVTDRLVVGVPEAGMEPYVPRISLTLAAINAARHVVFLVTGESKREAVRRAFGDDPDPTSPGAHVRPRSGLLTVYVDPAAAP